MLVDIVLKTPRTAEKDRGILSEKRTPFFGFERLVIGVNIANSSSEGCRNCFATNLHVLSDSLLCCFGNVECVDFVIFVACIIRVIVIVIVLLQITAMPPPK